MIQLRNVPDSLHRGLKARAAMAGMSLSDYLLAEIKEIAAKPTLAEFRERLHARQKHRVRIAVDPQIQQIGDSFIGSLLRDNLLPCQTPQHLRDFHIEQLRRM